MMKRIYEIDRNARHVGRRRGEEVVCSGRRFERRSGRSMITSRAS